MVIASGFESSALAKFLNFVHLAALDMLDKLVAFVWDLQICI